MSLILDALRKSEAERRRGQLPGLHVELTPPPPQAPRWALPRWWPALALALAGALLLLAWRAWGPSAQVEAAAPAATTASAPVPPKPATVATNPAAPVTGARIRGANEPPAQARPAPDRVSGGPLRSSSAPSAGAAAAGKSSPGSTAALPEPSPGAADIPIARTPAEPASAPPSAASAAMPPAPSITAATAAAGPVPVPAGAASPASARVAAAGGPETLERATAGPEATEPTRLADLSAGERRQLPPLKVSMHFWAPAPARRFAIVDGARVEEGDRIGSAVVEAITADAVVIAWHGRRVRVPIR